MKIGRNQPCPCGSGAKYKRCHGKLNAGPSEADVTHLLKQQEAAERIRQEQQGLGRPIIATEFGDHQVVAVRNRVFFAKEAKTFTDFLMGYAKTVLDPAWGNAEIAKPLAERHTIMQWYDAFCRYQREHSTEPGKLTEAPMVGVAACYLGLAYSLYLIDHNVELQARLVRRLKDPAISKAPITNCLWPML